MGTLTKTIPRLKPVDPCSAYQIASGSIDSIGVASDTVGSRGEKRLAQSPNDPRSSSGIGCILRHSGNGIAVERRW